MEILTYFEQASHTESDEGDSHFLEAKQFSKAIRKRKKITAVSKYHIIAPLPTYIVYS